VPLPDGHAFAVPFRQAQRAVRNDLCGLIKMVIAGSYRLSPQCACADQTSHLGGTRAGRAACSWSQTVCIVKSGPEVWQAQAVAALSSPSL
jgi:hypothetical protein